MLAQKDAQPSGIHGAGAQQIGKRFRRNIRNAKVPEHAERLPANRSSGHALHFNLGNVNASAQFQRIPAAGNVQDGQLWVRRRALQYVRDQPRNIINVYKLKLVLQIIAA